VVGTLVQFEQGFLFLFFFGVRGKYPHGVKAHYNEQKLLELGGNYIHFSSPIIFYHHNGNP
jgi:hypothetical protein